MRYTDAPEDFGDPFGEGSYALATVILDGHTLMMIAAFTLAGLVLFCACLWLGRGLTRRSDALACRASAQAIYDHIAYTLSLAINASGALQMERARELSAVIEARLGTLLVLRDKTGKPFEDLIKALNAPELAPGEVPKEVPPKVKVEMMSDEHRVRVWEALQGFHAVWSDRERVLDLIEGAQGELSRKATARDIYQHPALQPPPVDGAPTPTNPRRQKTSRKPKMHPAAEPVATVAVDPEGLPPLPPRSGRRLPKHKKNMLA